jgi:hypothetical protein
LPYSLYVFQPISLTQVYTKVYRHLSPLSLSLGPSPRPPPSHLPLCRLLCARHNTNRGQLFSRNTTSIERSEPRNCADTKTNRKRYQFCVEQIFLQVTIHQPTLKCFFRQ